MLMIRLAKIGKRKYRTFRVVVSDKRKDLFGPANETLGYYDPHTNQLTVNAERVHYWMGKGAKPSETLFNLFIEHRIISGAKVKFVKIKKNPEEKEVKVEGAQKSEKKEPSKEAPKEVGAKPTSQPKKKEEAPKK